MQPLCLFAIGAVTLHWPKTAGEPRPAVVEFYPVRGWVTTEKVIGLHFETILGREYRMSQTPVLSDFPYGGKYHTSIMLMIFQISQDEYTLFSTTIKSGDAY